MKNLKQKILSVTKIIVLSLMISIFAGQTSAQWVPPTSTPPPEDPFVAVERIDLPLNTGSSPQLKDGALLINANNVAQYFGLTIPYWGMLISTVLAQIDTVTAPQGLLHIFHNTYRRIFIRIEGSGPALVTDSADAKIGIGTLNPNYTVDIPWGNITPNNISIPIVRLGGDEPNGSLQDDEVSLQVNGRVKIMGGGPSLDSGNQYDGNGPSTDFAGPFPGAYLATLNGTGETLWKVPYHARRSLYNHNPSLLQYVSWPEAFSESGVASTASISPDPLNFLQPGFWHVTAFGTIGNACDTCSYTVTVSMRLGANGSLGTVDTPFFIRDHPDGNAEFSITRIVYVPQNTNLNYGKITVSVTDNISGTAEPLINGVSAYWTQY
ncbi:MAG: hypothetical protein AAB534_01375 [Patescibacteria group bacterium]